MEDLAVVILTFNEERHIERAIRSVKSVASEILVVDSGSSDRTVELALALGAKVLTNKFVNQAKQFKWALDNAPISAAWIMRLDADEVVERDLAIEIERRLPTLPADVTGINLRRKHYFMGRFIRFGGRFPLMMLRIFRRGRAQMEDRWMDEHLSVTEGRTVTFYGGFRDENLHDLTWFVDKHNKYATREAVQLLLGRLGLLDRSLEMSSALTSRQVATKRWIKERVYDRMPFQLSSMLYFAWRYIFQLGFLDGRPGVVYHFLQGFWYRFLVGAKFNELMKGISRLEGDDEKLVELSRLTGLDLATKK